MKSIILFLSLVMLLAFSGITPPQTKNNAAEAKKHSNIYVFMECEPVAEYEELGKIKLGMVSGCDWSVIRDKLIKKALKEYPNATGIIINNDLEGIAILLK